MTASLSYNYNGQGLQQINQLALSSSAGLYGIGGLVNTACVLKFFCVPSNFYPLVGQGSKLTVGNITGVAFSGGVETLTVSSTAGLSVGNIVNMSINGLVTANYPNGLNTTVQATILSATSVSFIATATLGAFTSAGTFTATNNTVAIQKVPIQANNVIEEQYTESVSLTTGYNLWCCLQQYFDDNHLIRWSSSQYNYAKSNAANTVNGLTLVQYTVNGGLAPLLPQLNAMSPGDPGDPVLLYFGANITIRYAS